MEPDDFDLYMQIKFLYLGTGRAIITVKGDGKMTLDRSNPQHEESMRDLFKNLKAWLEDEKR